MKNRLFLGLVFGILLQALPVSGQTLTLKILSYNIMNGGGDSLSQTATVILNSGVDVAGIQEIVDSAHAASLATLLPGWNYTVLVAGNSIGAVSIFTKYSIIETFPQGALIRAPSGEEFYIFNAHLQATPYGPYNIRDGLITNESQAVSEAYNTHNGWISTILSQITNSVPAGKPVFLVGDFNEPSHLDWTNAATGAGLHPFKVAWPTSLSVQQAGFRDSYREIYANEATRPGMTWTPKPELYEQVYHKSEVHDRIDFVYYRGLGLRVMDSKVIGENSSLADLVVNPYPSDHRAVVSTFTLSDVTTTDANFYRGGDTIRISWDYSSATTSKDWIGLVRQGALWTDYTGVRTSMWFYTDGARSGSKTIIAPNVSGIWQPAYFYNDGYVELARGKQSITIEAVTEMTSPVVSVVAADSTAAEQGSNQGSFSVSRTGLMAASLNISYTISGTATNGIDYTFIPSFVTIPAGSASTDITLTPIDDSAIEQTESVILNLNSNSSYTTGSSSSATINISDNDSVVDTTPPKISVVTPAIGAILSGVITVSAIAPDNTGGSGIVGVQFLLDGVNLGSEDVTYPYSVSFNTATATNGARIISARARDTAGNSSTSSPIMVVISNIIETPKLSPFPASSTMPTANTVQVSTAVLNVRQEASPYALRIGSVKFGEVFTKLEERNGWIKIQLLNGQIGWVSGQYVIVPGVNCSVGLTQNVTVSASVLNVRSSPSSISWYNIISTVRFGNVLKKIEERNGWIKVVIPNGQCGWVYRAYIK